MSELAVATERANRCMSSDMSGPLSDMPDSATLNAHVANTCLPPEERPTKTPIFNSVFAIPVSSWCGCGHPDQAV